MRTAVYANRTTKEILRDPLNLSFGIGFPLVILFLLTAIQNNIPVSLFELDKLTPGIAVFGLSFISLFSATLISKDRMSSMLTRMFTTPMKSKDYIIGYTLPLLPMSVAQSVVCYAVSIALGMKFTINVLLAILLIIPTAVIFIAIGLICGSLFNDKQVGGICGALLTNLVAWLSGTWFDLELVGGAFEKISYSLPFVHAVDMSRAAINGDYQNIFPHIWWVLVYAVVLMIIAILVFKHKMKCD